MEIHLSQRQIDVLILRGNGLTSKEAGKTLGFPSGPSKRMFRRCCRLPGARNIAVAVSYCISAGIIEFDDGAFRASGRYRILVEG